MSTEQTPVFGERPCQTDVTHQLKRDGVWHCKYGLRFFTTEDDQCLFLNANDTCVKDSEYPLIYSPDIKSRIIRLYVDDRYKAKQLVRWCELVAKSEKGDMASSCWSELRELSLIYGHFQELIPDHSYFMYEYEYLHSLFDREAFEDDDSLSLYDSPECPFSLFNCRERDFLGFCACCKKYNNQDCSSDDIKITRCMTLWSHCQLEEMSDAMERRFTRLFRDMGELKKSIS